MKPLGPISGDTRDYDYAATDCTSLEQPILSSHRTMNFTLKKRLNITPRVSQKQPGEVVYEMPHDSVKPRIKSVLMLEDDLALAEMVRVFLESNFCRVTHVTNGAEGLRKILDKDFDILLCDMVMPALPGDMFYLAVERAKKHLCSRFVFMTGHQADPKYDEFIRKVKGPMLWKPFLLSDLLSMLERTVEKNSPTARREAVLSSQETKWWM
jgi:CheY-like chemotaxis protein